ncbi:MAG: UDP-N-acetylmuramate--L-alanine ligase [Chloroflexi bacterium]|nr:UDP-N-acetylmuramate--L-alanine ligase [Chloroflexota bacterium]
MIPGQRVHIVGISGFGMSAIARILFETGYQVSGSDKQLSPLSEALSRDGATVYVGHDAGNIVGVEIVIASTAITDDNIELKSAEALGIPIMRRREAISMITAGHRVIAVAGTHGKTTTTALLTHVLIQAGLDPTYIVGGLMHNTFTNAGVGKGELFVIEADEYGDMFLGLTPNIAIITNLEYDHPDVFPNMKTLVHSFRQFISQLEEQGILVANVDNAAVAAFANNRLVEGLPVATFGIRNRQAEWTATNIEPTEKGTTRFILKQRNSPLGQVNLNLMGDYNVENALAVAIVARQLGVPFTNIADSFASFGGIGRRAEILWKMQGVTMVSDYAHHPTAIQASLKAWSQHPGTQRLWAVWQPHTYNRLRALSDEFAAAFTDAHEVLVTDVYSVREAPGEGIKAQDIAQMIRESSGANSRYSGNLDFTTRILADEVQAGDTVVILSAGDAPQIGQKLLKKLSGQ